MVLVVGIFALAEAFIYAMPGTCSDGNGGDRCGSAGPVSLFNLCSCTRHCLLEIDDNCCQDYTTVCAHDHACPANKNDTLLCRDGTECDPMTDADAFGCCRNHGGKWKCPSSMPFMCSGIG